MYKNGYDNEPVLNFFGLQLELLPVRLSCPRESSSAVLLPGCLPRTPLSTSWRLGKCSCSQVFSPLTEIEQQPAEDHSRTVLPQTPRTRSGPWGRCLLLGKEIPGSCHHTVSCFATPPSPDKVGPKTRDGQKQAILCRNQSSWRLQDGIAVSTRTHRGWAVV